MVSVGWLLRETAEISLGLNTYEPLFDVVSGWIVEPTAQFVTGEGSQIATNIIEKLCLVKIMLFSESMQKRRRAPTPRQHNTSISRCDF